LNEPKLGFDAAFAAAPPFFVAESAVALIEAFGCPIELFEAQLQLARVVQVGLAPQLGRHSGKRIADRTVIAAADNLRTGTDGNHGKSPD
jgi:hypothetical protein